LGLPGEIIDQSRSLLEGGDIQFESVLEAIEADKKRAEAERDEAIMLNIEMKKQKEEVASSLIWNWDTFLTVFHVQETVPLNTPIVIMP
jgi:hypothetical protein